MKYQIGQIVTSEHDVVLEKAFSKEKIMIPKGNQVIIGADGFAHHLTNGMIQPLASDDDVSGYNAEGIANYLFQKLSTRFPLDEMLDKYAISKNTFLEQLEYYLDDIGM